jgi:hypothetical protein
VACGYEEKGGAALCLSRLRTRPAPLLKEQPMHEILAPAITILVIVAMSAFYLFSY